ncbi:MAG TPA: APC family permease, partial [Planctomycetota bacterium]|nr:APC family permease [Planctomycetota bacterium]
GRVATLGEEIRDPRRSIPRAIILTLLATMLLYAAVAFVAIASVGAERVSEATRSAAAPLEVIARSFDVPAIEWLVAAGAITAMLGVLLNLLLGLSRVLLAMSRRADVPRKLSKLDEESGSPRGAVLVIGAVIAILALTGNVQTTWSFSAFTVLVYYALTNLAALRLPREARLYPRSVPAVGLVSCLGLAFWVEPRIWLSGLGWIAVGLAWHFVARRWSSRAARRGRAV